jgi:hypothetical protein
MLLGHGIDHKLHISETDITFPPIMLFNGIQEKIFTIENVGDYPVELSWCHLDR